MKRVLKIIPFLCIFVTSLFLVMIEDEREHVEYYMMQDYQYSPLLLNEDAVTVSEESILKLKQMADDNHIILAKQTYDNQNDKKIVYYSCDELSELLDEKAMQYQTLNQETDDTYASTEMSDDVNQGYQIHDLLENDHYYLYKFSTLFNSSAYKYGHYQVHYHDQLDLERFYSQVSDYFNIDSEILTGNAGVLGGYANEMTIGMAFCMFLLLLLYFSLTLFDLYKKSKKLGCLKLLGFTKLDILTVLMKKQMLQYALFSLILLILCKLLIPNADFALLTKMGIIYLFIMIVSVLIFYLALRIVDQYTETTNILKNHSILVHANRVCQAFKFILIGFLFLFTAYIFPVLIETRNDEQLLLGNEEIFDYAVFSKINMDNSEKYDTDRYLMFYGLLTEQEDIPYLYADFRDYRDSYDAQLELDHLYNATVDRHYLEYANMEIIDDNGNPVPMITDKMEYFIFPESKRNIVDEYLDHYETKMNRVYEPQGVNFERICYFYDDRSFNSLDFENKDVEVASPIFRVIGKGYPITYFEKKDGLDIAGTGMGTALKFNIGTDKITSYQNLKGLIEQAGLKDALWEQTFTSYNDYLGTQIANLKNGITTFISGFLACMILYLLALFQTFSLYLETQSRMISVKQSLGFTHKDIFKNMVSINLMISIIAYIILIPVCIIVLVVPWYLCIILALVYFIIDCVLTIAMTHFLHSKNLNLALKGR